MSPEQVIQIMREAMYTAIGLAAPFLLLALIVGFVISLFQSLTQIGEMTLSFVPKMLLVALALAIFFPWMLKILTKFTNQMIIGGWESVTHVVQYVLQ